MNHSPSREDPLARLTSTWLGGPIGVYARVGRSWLSPLVVLILVTTGVFAIGVVQKAGCIEKQYAAQQTEPRFQWRANEQGWQQDVKDWNDRQFAFSRLCYSDIAYLYRERGFADGHVAYLDDGGHPRLEYPVLTGAVMQVSAWATAAIGDGRAIHDSMVFFGITVVLLFCCAIATIVMLRRYVPDRPYDAMFVAAAPTLALDGIINWDLVAVAMTTGAVLALSRRRHVLAGVLIGLGAATKLYPLLLLGPLFLLALRSRRLREWSYTLLAAAVSWFVVNFPIATIAPDGWREFWVFNQDRVADLGSIWLALGIGTQSATLVNVLSLGSFALCCAGIAALVLLAPRTPRFAALALLVVAAFVLCNKVYSPQYVLWLLPLVAMVRPRWRDWTIWQGAEVFYWVAVWLHLANLTTSASGGPDQLYAFAILVRVGATIYLCVQVVRDILAPERTVPSETIGLRGRSPARRSLQEVTR